MKKQQILLILNMIKDIASNLVALCDTVAESIDELIEEKPEQIEAKVVEVNTPKKVVTLEEVRTKLSDLSRKGYTKDVKALLQKYGGDKLSAIDEHNYEALLHDAEEINNA